MDDETFDKLLDAGRVDEAIEHIQNLLSASPAEPDELHYLLGKAYWKKQDWKNCLDNYTAAIRINPKSRAAEAKKMVMEIINFYNKDLYNP